MPIHTSGGKAPLCPDCATTMRYIKGPMGDFWGCIRYPRCKRTLPIVEPIIIEEVLHRGQDEYGQVEEDIPETFEEKTQRWIREMWGNVPEVMLPKEIPLYHEHLDDDHLYGG